MASWAPCRVAQRLSRTLCRAHQRSLATATAIQSEQVRIVEVGPRDGLQNEKNTIPLSTKTELIERLAQTGLRTIEAGSFVSPKWTPQMANSSEILERLISNPPASTDPIVYQFLVPNRKGMDNFLKTFSTSSSAGSYPTAPLSPTADSGSALDTSSQDHNARPSYNEAIASQSEGRTRPEVEVSIFTAATETFTQKNTNCSITESLERFKPIFSLAKQNNFKVRAYISVALGCPYEGPDVDARKVAELAVNLLEMGADEISVADTTGMGTAPKTRALLQTLLGAGIEAQDLALHFHDTYGQALVNTVVGLEAGIRTFDAAVAGLGGCPFSPGATGNVATEDLVHMFESVGLQTGVEPQQLAQVGDWISRELGRPNESRAGKATLARLKRR